MAAITLSSFCPVKYVLKNSERDMPSRRCSSSLTPVMELAIGVAVANDFRRFADRLTGFIGPTARQVIVRLTAFLLMCIGVQIVVTAIGDLVARWRVA